MNVNFAIQFNGSDAAFDVKFNFVVACVWDCRRNVQTFLR